MLIKLSAMPELVAKSAREMFAEADAKMAARMVTEAKIKRAHEQKRGAGGRFRPKGRGK